MSVKIFYFLVFFLIMTLRSCAHCIKIEASADPDVVQRKPRSIIKFSDQSTAPEPTLNTYSSSNQVPSQTYPTLNIDESIHKNLNMMQNTQKSLRDNSLNVIYNTGEYYPRKNYYIQQPTDNYNPLSAYGPYRIYGDNSAVQNSYRGESSLNTYDRTTSHYHPSLHQNYLSIKQSQPEYHTGEPYPYRNEPNQQYSYDYPPYASTFNNFQAIPNSLFGLINGFGTGDGDIQNQLGKRITKALQDISSHDDLNCVPKLLCQMVGQADRRSDLPSFLTAPGIVSLISALPGSSPLLNYGRAALLGLTGGEDNCLRTYNKCPSNEDDLLFYLNNHRGGFFRFFNGDDDDKYNNYQHGQQTYRPETFASESNNVNTQSSLASLLQAGGDFNPIGSLTSLLPYLTQNSESNGLVSLVGNLLGNLANLQRSSLKRHRRSFDQGNFTTYPPDTTLDLKTEARKEIDTESVEARIMNKKESIFAEANNKPGVSFPQNDIVVRNPKLYRFDDIVKTPNFYGNDANNDAEQQTSHSSLIKIIFPSQTKIENLRFDTDRYSLHEDSKKVQFENDALKFFNPSNDNYNNNRDLSSHRYSKISSQPNYSKYNTYYDYDEYYNNRKPHHPYNPSNDYWNNANKYGTTTRAPYYSTYVADTHRPNNYNHVKSHGNLLNSGRGEGNIYVTNSKGVVEYYIKQDGQKVYV